MLRRLQQLLQYLSRTKVTRCPPMGTVGGLPPGLMTRMILDLPPVGTTADRARGLPDGIGILVTLPAVVRTGVLATLVAIPRTVIATMIGTGAELTGSARPLEGMGRALDRMKCLPSSSRSG